MAAGRPPKFKEPSSPITVTLPHRILRRLEELDLDRAKAIVKCVEAMTESALSESKKVEIVKVSDDAGLIITGPCRSLATIPWIRLVEIAPARYLLSIPSGGEVAALELAIIDLLEHLPKDNDYEKSLLTELRQRLSHHRRQGEVFKGEILFVGME